MASDWDLRVLGTCSKLSCLVSVIFALTHGGPLYGNEGIARHQELWSKYAAQLDIPDVPRVFGRQYFLPMQEFDPATAEIRRAADAYAEQLILLAREQLQVDPAFAYQLLHEAAFYGRDNLADKVVQGRQGKSVAIRSKLGTNSHPRLKWKRREYYRITSEHYQVVSRDQQTGVEIAQRLETLYAVWRQLFFECWSDADALKKALDQQKTLAPRTSRLHRVVLFSNQQAYTQFLRKTQPRIGITRGFYDLASRTSFFFDSEPQNTSTQLHEATHQLFQELQRASERLPLEQNFWALEGVAMYMESLRRQGHCVSLGGFAARRLQFARYRRLQEDYYVPLQELIAYGRDRLQRDPDIRKLYSQSAGLCHLMIDAEGGEYRQGFVRYLKSIYEGRDTENALRVSLTVELSNLDAAYVQFLQVDDRKLTENPIGPDSLQSLCLGHTAVSDVGLKRLTPQRKLEWLDLANVPATRAGLEFIRDTRTLRQISFDRCNSIGDDVLEWISQNPNLDELDLTATAVTDRGIGYLTGHAKLQTLWVGSTQLSDASVRVLASLPSLARLQCAGTGISESGLQKLRQAKPDLILE